jgi:antitoxin component of MazEF toxin-antitoxin module
MMRVPQSPRLVVRATVKLRRQGGSLVMSLPRNIVRNWKLEAGARLIVRTTENGILIFPRYSLPYLSPSQREELFRITSSRSP